MSSCLRSDEADYRRPSEQDYLGSYNELLGTIAAAHPDSLPHIASATLGRMEAQTHFFERVEKHVQLRQRLLADPGLSVVLAADDAFLHPFLGKEFPGRVLAERTPSLRERLKGLSLITLF
ncbi:MAG: hypothetical protein PHU21_12565, partial [Elusimicrobia bacterium]|nr:hypothetical protein [Elusimicrobiota bacterium]